MARCPSDSSVGLDAKRKETEMLQRNRLPLDPRIRRQIACCTQQCPAVSRKIIVRLRDTGFESYRAKGERIGYILHDQSPLPMPRVEKVTCCWLQCRSEKSRRGEDVPLHAPDSLQEGLALQLARLVQANSSAYLRVEFRELLALEKFSKGRKREAIRGRR